MIVVCGLNARREESVEEDDSFESGDMFQVQAAKQKRKARDSC